MHVKINRPLALALALLFGGIFSSGPAAWAQRYNFHQYGLEQGLPQSQVGVLVSDDRGYLWAGLLAGGLTRFDGQEFRTYNFTEDSVGLGAIFGLAFDDRQQLWVESSTGLFRFNGREFFRYGQDKGYPFGPITGLLVPDDGDRIYIINGVPGVVTYVDLAQDRVVVDTLPDHQRSLVLSDVVVDAPGKLLLSAAGGGLYRWGADSLQAAEIPSPEMTALTDMYVDAEGQLWIAGAQGAFYWQDTAWVDPFAEYWQGNPQVFTIITQQPNGAYWFTSFQGVYRLWNGRIQVFGAYEGLTDNQIFSLVTDTQGNPWFGSYGQGMYTFSGDAFQYLGEQEGLPAKVVMGLQEMDGAYYLGDFGQGLVKYSPEEKSFAHYTATSGEIPSNLVLYATKDRAGRLLIGYRIGGWTRYDGETWETHDYPPATIPSLAAAFIEDTEGDLWIGDLVKGLYRWDGEAHTRYSTADGLPSNVIRSLYLHRPDGALWVGTSQGIVQYRDGTFSDLPFTDSLRKWVCYAIKDGPDGKIWMALLEGGVASWDGTTLRQYTTADGLTSDITYQISWDREGTLYQGTERGVDRLSIDGEGRLTEVDHLGYAEGFLGIETNSNASTLDEEGRLWFGTVDGVTIFDPQHRRKNPIPPQTEMLGVQLDYLPVDWGERGYAVDYWRELPTEAPTFSHRENTLTFQYAGISLSHPEQVAYSYRLLGQDEDWSPEVKSREVTFTNLSPGHYTFEIMARNEDHVWNEVGTPFAFTITPPIWQRPWFLILAALAGAGLLFGFIRGRTRQLRIAKERLEHAVQVRTEEILAQKEEIEAQRDMIEQKNRDITDSIRYAQRIQSSILPLQHKMEAAFPQHFLLYRPRDIVSGDFYWFAEQDGWRFLAAVDCTGHGVPGAFMSLIASQHLNQLVIEDGITDPATILNQLNERVQESLHQKGEYANSRDGLDIALLGYHPTTQRVTFAGAKRPLYMCQDGELQEIKGDKLFIGGGHRKLMGGKFTTHHLTLTEPATFYLTSDGYADQFGGEQGRKFMVKRMKNEILRVTDRTMDEQKAILEGHLESWMKGFAQTDDILVIGVRLG